MSKTAKLAKAYSGILGEEIVIKKGRRGTNVIQMAKACRVGAVSDAQFDTRDRMRRAAIYARVAMQDPELSGLYKRLTPRGGSPYREASNDFLRKPKFRGIDCSGYSGKPGDQILVKVTHKITLTGVSATLWDPDGSMIESGPCVEHLPTGKYIYTGTCHKDVITGMILSVSITDIPGNRVEQRVTL
jgi:hypothetical protein